MCGAYAEILENRLMKEVYRLFLDAVGASLEKISVNWQDDISPEEWTQLFSLFDLHGILPMGYNAVYGCPAAKTAETVLLPYKRRAMQSVMIQTVKTDEFLKLINSLKGEGVTLCVLKGIVCRSLYPLPDLRRSGDEDILVSSDGFFRLHDAMVRYGMYTEDDVNSGDFEITYIKKGSPLKIEVHTSLFSPDSQAYGHFNGLFDGICGRLITADVNGTHICTLGHTDHLLYLICHAFKHFIHSGVGIRQVCDIVLYANKFGAFIDWDCVWEKCRQIRADVFAEAVFCIGRQFLTFDPEKSGYIEHRKNRDADCDGLLEDILCAGIYGGSELSRKHSSNMTLNAFSAANKGKKAGSGILSSIFLPLSEMRSRYKCTYLEKFPFLLPVAWAGRICKYGKEVIVSRCGGKHNGTSEAVRIGRKRIALMRKYDIIK